MDDTDPARCPGVGVHRSEFNTQDKLDPWKFRRVLNLLVRTGNRPTRFSLEIDQTDIFQNSMDLVQIDANCLPGSSCQKTLFRFSQNHSNPKSGAWPELRSWHQGFWYSERILRNPFILKDLESPSSSNAKVLNRLLILEQRARPWVWPGPGLCLDAEPPNRFSLQTEHSS